MTKFHKKISLNFVWPKVRFMVSYQIIHDVSFFAKSIKAWMIYAFDVDIHFTVALLGFSLDWFKVH